nr:BrnT family toxin [Roseofilum acuticapitatum]
MIAAIALSAILLLPHSSLTALTLTADCAIVAQYKPAITLDLQYRSASIMEFEWDEAKRLANLRKHGIDFIDVPRVFDGDIITVEDDRFDYGEQRFITLGLLQSRVVVIVHTEREDYTRIISARKATKYEEQSYFQQLSN